MLHQRIKWIIVYLLWFVGLPTSSLSAPLAEEVSTLRAEVDKLANQLEVQRLTARDEMVGLRAERAELRRQLRLEKIREETLSQLSSERTQQEHEQQDRMSTLLKPVQRSVASAKRYVSATMPFKRDERLRYLNKLEADLSVTHPDLGRVLTRLWRFVEEEEAMAREIGLVQQVIELDGKRLLADVVRIGMALMYFRLPTGELGWVVNRDDQWFFEHVAAVEARSTIARLFDDIENNQNLGRKRLLLSTKLPRATSKEIK